MTSAAGRRELDVDIHIPLLDVKPPRDEADFDRFWREVEDALNDNGLCQYEVIEPHGEYGRNKLAPDIQSC